MLTRKHFKAMAEKNAQVFMDLDFTKMDSNKRMLIRHWLNKMVQNQASYLRTTNPNFQWGKFLDASGVEPLEEN